MRPESAYTPARPDCPRPWYWRAWDEHATEWEVSCGIAGLVRMLQPDAVVETGAYHGHTSWAIGAALRENGHGHLWAIEVIPQRASLARGRCDGLPVSVVEADSLGWTPPAPIDLLFCDGGDREAELRHLLPHLNPAGLVLLHDSHRPTEREILRRLRADGLIRQVLDLPTPRGIALCQT